jgi:hypothetical protein
MVRSPSCALLATLALAGCTSPAGARRPDPPPRPPPSAPLAAADFDMVVAVEARLGAARSETDRQFRERAQALATGDRDRAGVTPPDPPGPPPPDAAAAARELGFDPDRLIWVKGRIAEVVLEARRRRERDAALRFRAAHRDGLRRAIERAPEADKARFAEIAATVEAGAKRDLALDAAATASEADLALVARYAGALGLTLLPDPAPPPTPPPPPEVEAEMPGVAAADPAPPPK